MLQKTHQKLEISEYEIDIPKQERTILLLLFSWGGFTHPTILLVYESKFLTHANIV